MALFKILRGNAANLPKEKKDGYAYFCTDTHDFYIDYKKADGTLTRGQLNANAADKLSTGRTIDLGTAVYSTATTFDGSKNITIPVTGVKQAYLTWGGKAINSGVTPIGAALDSRFSSNKLAFAEPAGFKFETSTDNGNSWTEKTINNDVITNIMSRSIDEGLILAPDTDTEVLTTSQARITLEAKKLGIYISPSKLLIEVNIPGHIMYCDIETKTRADGAEWKQFGSYQIIGWSGWNDIPLVLSAFGGYSDVQLTNTHFVRMTFRVTSVSASHKTSKCSLKALRLFAKNDWGCNSELARNGHLYSYDWKQNATFPKKVTAATLASTGNATVAGTLSVTGASTLTGAVNSGPLTASSLKSHGALTVSGNSTLTGTLTVKGNTTLGDSTSDTVTIKGSLTASGKVTSSEFVGDLTGNADTATTAENAEQAETIAWCYFDATGIIS